MDDLEEFESWTEDLADWERFQDKLEKLHEENSCGNLYENERIISNEH